MRKLAFFALVLTLFYACQDEDVTERVVSVCEIPTAINTSDATHNSVTISWQNPNEIKDVVVYYGPSGFLPISGNVLQTSESSIEITGLVAETNYDVYVQAMCSFDNISMMSAATSFTTSHDPVVPQFLPNLSELNLFEGNLSDLIPNPDTFEYKLSTPLYTDHAHKLRLLSLPLGTTMEYDGDGFPVYPNGSVLAKTFYYNYDETNLSAGRIIIETRVLIRQGNVWHIGNYVWNETQTDAVLDENTHTIPISWINENGMEMSTDYVIPNYVDCITCHQNNGNRTPIGPQLRSMNFDVNGSNQLQQFIDAGHLTGAPDPSSIAALPDWTNTNIQTETRVRAYFDMNCAHCHAPGGYHNINYYNALDMRMETPFNQSGIYDKRWSIITRIQTQIPGYSMPFIGVTLPHAEAIDLIIPYLESL